LSWFTICQLLARTYARNTIARVLKFYKLFLTCLEPGEPLVQKTSYVAKRAYKNENSDNDQKQTADDLYRSEVSFHPPENAQKGIEAHRSYQKWNTQA